MGVIKDIQSVLDNIINDAEAAGLRGQPLVDVIRDHARASGVSSYFVNQYVDDVVEKYRENNNEQ